LKRVPTIEMQGISKSFPGVIANDKVDFRVYPGEIHALLGENGAGKSTLMSILAGLYRPDEGILKIKGQVVKINSPRQALEAGIGMIYQHLRLIDKFTVAENIVLGTEKPFKLLKQSEINEKTRQLSEKFALNVNPATLVRHLSLGERQRVEILKMLYRGCEVLIMDEPTTVLTPQEVEDLFKILRLMASQGKAIVIITHKLHEVMQIADYVTVLRKGKVAGYDKRENLNEKMLTSMMIAREVAINQAKHECKIGAKVLEVKDIKVKAELGHWAVKNASLDLRQGEIMAIAGVAGNGQRELIESIAGLQKISAGQITLVGENISDLTVRERLEKGINLVPEDRLGMGLVGGLSAIDNSVLRSYFKPPYAQRFFLNFNVIKAYTQKLITDYNVVLTDINYPIKSLSGGNLQKMLLGREIDQKPRLLMAAYPVRGLDVAAAEAVYKIFLDEKEKGMAILLVLEDLDDIFRLADRVAVMYDGEIQAILNVADTDINQIGALMLGA
jgi:ABC-type uncharacterized transport system ATPase subunit